VNNSQPVTHHQRHVLRQVWHGIRHPAQTLETDRLRHLHTTAATVHSGRTRVVAVFGMGHGVGRTTLTALLAATAYAMHGTSPLLLTTALDAPDSVILAACLPEHITTPFRPGPDVSLADAIRGLATAAPTPFLFIDTESPAPDWLTSEVINLIDVIVQIDTVDPGTAPVVAQLRTWLHGVRPGLGPHNLLDVTVQTTPGRQPHRSRFTIPYDPAVRLSAARLALVHPNTLDAVLTLHAAINQPAT
jgi:hypothetical protein